MMLTATSCGLSYALINQKIPLIVNYGPMLVLDIFALLMRIYYTYVNENINQNINQNIKTIDVIDLKV